MLTRHHATFAALALLATAPSAQDFGEPESPWYFEMGLGFGSAEDSQGVSSADGIGYDEGYMVRAGLGYNLFDLRDDGKLSFNVEAEYLLLHNSISDSDFSTILSSDGRSLTMNTVMFSGLVDWELSDTTSFEIGGGLGVALNIDFQTEENQFGQFENDDDTAVVAQLRLGMTHKLGGYDNHRFDLGYRYVKSDSLSLTENNVGTSFDIEYGVHVLELGMRWSL